MAYRKKGGSKSRFKGGKRSMRKKAPSKYYTSGYQA